MKNHPVSSELASHQIPVSKLEMNLVWPVNLQPCRNDNGELRVPGLDPREPGFLGKWVDAIMADGKTASKANSKAVWEDVGSDFPADYGPSYAEFCYFHPFVRNFLYVSRDDLREASDAADNSNKDAVNRNLRILRRTDLGASAQLEYRYSFSEVPGGKALPYRSTFAIKSCWLYLFDTTVAVLELQISHRCTQRETDSQGPDAGALSLRNVMKLQDIIRRVYSAYWSIQPGAVDNSVQVSNHHLPDSVSLTLSDQSEKSYFGNMTVTGCSADSARSGGLLASNRHKKVAGQSSDDKAGFCASSQLASVAEQLEYTRQHREPHTASIWRTLIAPLGPVKTRSSADDFPLSFEHIQDDRVPMMSYIELAPVNDQLSKLRTSQRISTGDWLRLAMLDDEGDSATYPYSPAFYEHSGGDPLAAFAYDRFWHPSGHLPAQPYHSTRWLCSGFGFVAVGEQDPYFYSDAHAGALAHFNHHYMAMFMVGIFHRASLLQYKHRLAEVSDATLSKKRATRHLEYRFRRETERLKMEMMRFRTMYWFSELSNQLQGQEIFQKMREHLRLDEIFADVNADIDAASDLLAQQEDNDRNRSAHLLTVIAGAFVAVAPLLLYFEHLLTHASSKSHAAVWIGSFLFLLGLFLYFTEADYDWRWVQKHAELIEKPANQLLNGVLCFACSVGIVIYGIALIRSGGNAVIVVASLLLAMLMVFIAFRLASSVKHFVAAVVLVVGIACVIWGLGIAAGQPAC